MTILPLWLVFTQHNTTGHGRTTKTQKPATILAHPRTLPSGGSNHSRKRDRANIDIQSGWLQLSHPRNQTNQRRPPRRLSGQVNAIWSAGMVSRSFFLLYSLPSGQRSIAHIRRPNTSASQKEQPLMARWTMADMEQMIWTRNFFWPSNGRVIGNR